MSIGEVLSLLRADFPEISISKIRFLEAEGLIEPERTQSGYRKFTHRDVERLRYVLTSQREHYLPLKVIKVDPKSKRIVLSVSAWLKNHSEDEVNAFMEAHPKRDIEIPVSTSSSSDMDDMDDVDIPSEGDGESSDS